MSQFFYWLFLVGMTIFQYHAALVSMVNEGYSRLFIFLLLSFGATFAIVFVYKVSGLAPVRRRIRLPDFIGSCLENWKIVKSIRSYRSYKRERRNRGIRARVSEWVIRSIKTHGYLAVFGGGFLPIPFLRVSTVVAIATRATKLDKKKGFYLVIFASELRMLLEIIFYERLQWYFVLVNKLTVFRLALILIGLVISTFIIDWVSYAIKDNHFSPDRFD